MSAPSWMNCDAFGRPVYLIRTALGRLRWDRLERGDSAKVAFASENLWVAVLWRWEYAGQIVYSGTLANAPLVIRLDHGDRVEFFPENVIDVAGLH